MSSTLFMLWVGKLQLEKHSGLLKSPQLVCSSRIAGDYFLGFTTVLLRQLRTTLSFSKLASLSSNKYLLRTAGTRNTVGEKFKWILVSQNSTCSGNDSKK